MSVWLMDIATGVVLVELAGIICVVDEVILGKGLVMLKVFLCHMRLSVLQWYVCVLIVAEP